MRNNNKDSPEPNPRFDPLNIRIVIPGLSGKPTPRSRRVAKVILGVMMGFVVLFTAALLATTVFIAGVTYSQVSEHADKPLRVASLNDPQSAISALNTQIRYMGEVANLYPVAVAGEDRTAATLAARTAQLESLKLEAAALQGKSDAESVRKFIQLRTRIRALPALAGSITWKLLTEPPTLVALGFLLFYVFASLLTITPVFAKVNAWIDNLGKPKTQEAAA